MPMELVAYRAMKCSQICSKASAYSPAPTSSIMIPVPSGSASNRRRGNGFTMSKLRKSIKPATRYFQCTGTPIRAIICPATSSITTNPGSSLPLSLATTVEGGMPARVIAIEASKATQICHCDGIQLHAHHQSNTVTAEAHVPEPGCRWPMPKKVAMSQERRDLEVEIDVILFQTAIEYFYHIIKLRYVPPIDIRYKNSDTPVNIDNRYKKDS